MSTIGEISREELAAYLRTTGIYLHTGPFTYHVVSTLAAVAEGLHLLYGGYPLSLNKPFADFHISMKPVNWVRRWLRPKVHFLMDNHSPFYPMQMQQTWAFFEWGMNWCVSSFPNQYIKLHAAVLEKNGHALIMPGSPGSGKSTLSAALLLRGWRLLSDEHALVSLSGASVTPVCRPVSLKNKSIEVVREFAPEAVIGAVTENTHKGTVAHLKSDLFANSLDCSPVKAAWLVFPRYSPGSPTRLESKHKAESFINAARQSFNYSLLGETGFHAMTELIDKCDCYDFVYSRLDEAISVFDSLSESA